MGAEDLHRAVVIGAGTMGAGIAGELARAGCQVELVDLNEPLLAAGLERLQAGYRALIDAGEAGQAFAFCRAQLEQRAAAPEGGRRHDRHCKPQTLLIVFRRVARDRLRIQLRDHRHRAGARPCAVATRYSSACSSSSPRQSDNSRPSAVPVASMVSVFLPTSTIFARNTLAISMIS